jgi:hypothetical protein
LIVAAMQPKTFNRKAENVMTECREAAVTFAAALEPVQSFLERANVAASISPPEPFTTFHRAAWSAYQSIMMTCARTVDKVSGSVPGWVRAACPDLPAGIVRLNATDTKKWNAIFLGELKAITDIMPVETLEREIRREAARAINMVAGIKPKKAAHIPAKADGRNERPHRKLAAIQAAIKLIQLDPKRCKRMRHANGTINKAGLIRELILELDAMRVPLKDRYSRKRLERAIREGLETGSIVFDPIK